MKKINLQFDYSLEYEKKRIQNTLAKADWYIENGYSKYIKLPAGEKLEDIDTSKPTAYLLDKASEKYDEEVFKKMEKLVTKRWDEFSVQLENYFQETSLEPEDTYHIKLTRYGVGGSYNTPDTVIINIQKKDEIRISRTILHEIVHLSIQSFIDKYKVEQWEKERIVDLILHKITNGESQMQKIPVDIDIKSIDEIFEKYYPNVEEVIKNVR